MEQRLRFYTTLVLTNKRNHFYISSTDSEQEQRTGVAKGEASVRRFEVVDMVKLGRDEVRDENIN